MKILVIGNQSNSELYRFIELLGTHALQAHEYMVDTMDESELQEKDILPDEYLHTLGPDAHAVLELISGVKRRVTTREAVEQADIITVSPGQLEELAMLLPNDDFKIVLVTEEDTNCVPEDELGDFDKKLLDIFNNFTDTVSRNVHASSIYKYDAQSMDSTGFAEYIASQKKAHDNLVNIVWRLIELGNITFAGGMDVNGKPLKHDKNGKVVQFNPDGQEYIPIDRFASIVANDDEALATTIRVWLSSGIDIPDCEKQDIHVQED